MGTTDPAQLIALIAKSALFNAIPETRIAEILPQIIHLELPRGSALFHQGSPSDSVYVVVKGSLVAYFLSTTGQPKIVGQIEPFETIGELGALSTEPRSLTVKASSDAELIEIPSELFRKLCEEFPVMLFSIVRPLVTRSLNTIKLLQTEKKPEHIVFFPADKNLDFTFIQQEIQECIDKSKTTTQLKINAIEQGFFDQDDEQINGDNVYINFINEKYDPYSLQTTIEKTNNFYLVADGTKNVEIDDFATRILSIIKNDPSIKLHLVLLYPENTKAFPVYTTAWLKKYKFFLHHHIRKKSIPDFQRLFRFLNGTPIGVIFGGGGVKGLAHLGVLRALIENKIPIDMIGGTSVGSLLAICYAWTQSYEESVEHFRVLLEQCYKALSLQRLVWPLVSLFSSEPTTTSIQDIFASAQLENLWIPAFCISSNLSTRHEVIHRSGPIWQAIRASGSIPGLIPPVVIDGEIHFDGGLLNNLPVDVMRNLLGPNSIIIASKLSSQDVDKKQYNFPPKLTLKETFLYKFRFGYRHYRFPYFIDMFLNSLLLGSSQKEEDNAYSANILINPPLSKFKSITRSRKHEEHLMNMGYEEAIKILKKHTKLDLF